MNTFSDIADSLLRKVDKYIKVPLPGPDPLCDLAAPHLMVVSALLHVVDFLRAQGIPRFQGLPLNSVIALAQRLKDRELVFQDILNSPWENLQPARVDHQDALPSGPDLKRKKTDDKDSQGAI